MKHLLFLITFLYFSSLIQAGNKIVYLISPPRCLSTAFMRMFQARGDFAVVNEPAWDAYNMLLADQNLEAAAWNEYQSILAAVLQMSQYSHVLVKEISFSVEAFLFDNALLLKNPDVHFIFLTRDPQDALISFAKKRFREVALQRFGYPSSYLLFQKIKKEGANPPLIITAEELSRYPEQIVQALCYVLGIPFIPESLQWPDLGDNFTGIQEWGERKDQGLLYHWHDAAIHSTGFKPLATYARDANGKPTFQEVAVEDLPEVLAIYDLMLPYYQALIQEVDYRIMMK